MKTEKFLEKLDLKSALFLLNFLDAVADDVLEDGDPTHIFPLLKNVAKYCADYLRPVISALHAIPEDELLKALEALKDV